MAKNAKAGHGTDNPWNGLNEMNDGKVVVNILIWIKLIAL